MVRKVYVFTRLGELTVNWPTVTPFERWYLLHLILLTNMIPYLYREHEGQSIVRSVLGKIYRRKGLSDVGLFFLP